MQSHLKTLSSTLVLFTLTSTPQAFAGNRQAKSTSIFTRIESPVIRVMSPDECWSKKSSGEPSLTGTPLGNSAQPLTQTQAQQASQSAAQNEMAKSEVVSAANSTQAKAKASPSKHGDGMWNPFTYHPDGSSPRFRSAQCSPEKIQELMIESPDIGAQSEKVVQFFKTCENEFAYYGRTDWHALLESVSSDYDYCDNSQIRELMITLPDGNKVRALLGIQAPNAKGEYEPRPLVIIKGGVFANAGDSTTRIMIMHYFDEAPFNVLVLGNDTGTEYVADNQHVALGGFDEGQQLIEITKLIKASAVGPLITSVHISAVSLGSEGALFASYLNSFSKQQGRPYIDSVMALCPVVNLEPSIHNLFSGKIKGRLVRDVFLSDFYSVLQDIPVLGNILTGLKKSVASEIPQVVANGAIEYYEKVPASWGVSPFQGTQIKSDSEFWQRNNFLQIAKDNLRTPTLAFGAEDDWVVEPEKNSMALREALKAPSAAQSRVKTALVDRGNHCAFESSYGWDVFSSFLKSYALSRSPDLLKKRHTVSAAFPTELMSERIQLASDEVFVGVHFKFIPNYEKVIVTFDYTNSEQSGQQLCDGMSPYQMPETCLNIKSVKIPLNRFPSWAHATQTRADADSLTRWANANVRMLTSQGAPINYQGDLPTTMKWTQY